MQNEMVNAEIQRLLTEKIPLKSLLYKEQTVFNGKTLFTGNKGLNEFIEGASLGKNNPFAKLSFSSRLTKISSILRGSAPLRENYLNGFLRIIEKRLEELDIYSRPHMRFIKNNLVKHQELNHHIKNYPDRGLKETIEYLYRGREVSKNSCDDESEKKNKTGIYSLCEYTKNDLKLAMRICFHGNKETVNHDKFLEILDFILSLEKK